MGQSQPRFEVVVEGDGVRYVESQTATVQKSYPFRIKLVNNSYVTSHVSVSLDREHIGTWELGRTSWVDVTIDPRTACEFHISKRGKYRLQATFETKNPNMHIEEDDVSVDICVN